MRDYYEASADRLAADYESVSTPDVHGSWLHMLPTTKSLILDVGAGSGRDAAWLAGKGHEVFAVEPSEHLRRIAGDLHRDASINWLDDRLPGLDEVNKLDFQFDVILLSGVWMHVPRSARERAFRKLADLLRPGGIIVLTLRDASRERGMYPVSVEEVRNLARRSALEVVLDIDERDALGREEVRWQTLVLRLPDDGTGALPLLRHVVVNDDVSSTYKLALLRSLVRIADGARGVVLMKDEHFVEVPFGLVALYWLRQYHRLILGHKFLQSPDGRLGFAKDGFEALSQLSPHDLRVGSRFTGGHARNVVAALRDARRTIQTMPAHFITFPGTSRSIFHCATKPTRLVDEVTIDLDFLESMGTFSIPRPLWEAMSRYACWLEPAILDRWCELMIGYDEKVGREMPLQHYRRALSWLDADRSTVEVRRLAEGVRAKGRSLYCVWSGKKLRRTFDVDHCFPFAHWPNNDLWNLFPSHPSVNNQKRDRLFSAQALEQARERILEWWQAAYSPDSYLKRLFNEASISLPSVSYLKWDNDTKYDQIMAGMQQQRIRLKRDQQIPEWEV